MCGIFGVLWHKPTAHDASARLARTARLLEHRGPDHGAVFSDGRVGLVHTRLALVDLDARSHQPLWDASGRYCLLFNGEIYNFRTMRDELLLEGAAFRTTSDTEVLLEWIVHRGLDETLATLEGMFAFVLYDSLLGSLTVARDRFGIKPLYVHDADDAFMVASEVWAFQPWVRLEPDRLSISSYLQGSGGPSAGRTFFKGISILPPGTVTVAAPRSPVCRRQFADRQELWEPAESARLAAMPRARLVDLVEEHLFEGVRLQLLADVPVGVLCSGGIDSSIITAMAARVHRDVAIFHANVVGPSSELGAARAVASHLGLELKAVDVEDDDALEMMPDVISHCGHPFTYHPNSVPFLMVSRLVRNHGIKAVLSGEGADECFVGYPWLIFDIREALLGAPANLRGVYRLLRRLVRSPAASTAPSTDGDVRSLVRGLHNQFETELTEHELRNDLERRGGRHLHAHEVVTLSQLGYHLRTLLHRNDCLGMAASIEARFPFLHTPLVRLAVNMPYRAKVRFSPTAVRRAHCFLRDKWVLRKVAERYLPRAIAARDKVGFPTHAQERMRIAPGFARRSFVADLFALSDREADFLVLQADQSLRMKLLQLEVWARLFLTGSSPDEVGGWLRTQVGMAGSKVAEPVHGSGSRPH